VTRARHCQLALRFGADDFGSVMFEENWFQRGHHLLHQRRRHRAAYPRWAPRHPRNVKYEWLTDLHERSEDSFMPTMSCRRRAAASRWRVLVKAAGSGACSRLAADTLLRGTRAQVERVHGVCFPVW